MLVWSFILAGLGLIQLWLSGSKFRFNSLVGMLTSFGWCCYGFQFGQWGFILSGLIFFVVHVRNWIRWSK